MIEPHILHRVEFLRDAYSYLEKKYCEFQTLKGLGDVVIGGGEEIDIMQQKEVLIKKFGERAERYYKKVLV